MKAQLWRDSRGFVLSGIALLLILPAMLLAASFLTSINIGSDAKSMQSLSSKVSYTGLDIESIIYEMRASSQQVKGRDAANLRDNFVATTGLLVDITPGTYTVVLDSKKLGSGKSLELNLSLFGRNLYAYAENTGPTFYADLRYSGKENIVNSSNFTISLSDNEIRVEIVGARGWVEFNYTVVSTMDNSAPGISVKVSDPRSASEYLITIKP